MDELLKKLVAIDAELDTILANDDLTDDQRARHDQLQKDRATAVKAIEREKERLARVASRQALAISAQATAAAATQVEEEAKAEAARQAALASTRQARQITNRITTPDSPTPVAPQLDGTTAPYQATPQLIKLVIPAVAKRFSQLSNFKGRKRHPKTGIEMDADERAFRFGMWGAAQLVVMNPMRFGYLKPFVEEMGEQITRQLAAVSSSDASGYSYLIPEEFGADIIDLRERYGVARRLLKMVPMTSDTRVDPRRRGGLTSYFVAEGGAITESNKIWDDVRLTAKELAIISRVSSQVNMDSIINWGDDLAGEIAYEYSKKEDDCAFNGDGTSTYGHITGVRTKLKNCDNLGNPSVGLYTQATGNTWGAFVNADFDNTIGLLPQYADVPGETCWVMHRTFFYAVIERLVQASGGVMAYEIRQGATEAPNVTARPLYKGYPVEFSQIMPSATATGTTVFALLGNFKLGASFGDRQMDSVAFSEHATVNGQSVFERNQIAIRGIERFDINIHDVGHASVANGGDAQTGPIVGLAGGA